MFFSREVDTNVSFILNGKPRPGAWPGPTPTGRRLTAHRITVLRRTDWGQTGGPDPLPAVMDALAPVYAPFPSLFLLEPTAMIASLLARSVRRAFRSVATPRGPSGALARRSVAWGVLASLCMAAPGWGVDVVVVEEHWELRIGAPDAESSAPQVSMVMAPFNHLNDTYLPLHAQSSHRPNVHGGGHASPALVGRRPRNEPNGQRYESADAQPRGCDMGTASGTPRRSIAV